MRHLNINELHSEINRRKERRNKSFDAVLEKCHEKIKKACKSELYRTLYDVPDFLLGYPIYKLNECILYIYKYLQQDGFIVKYFFPKTLYISWDLKEINNYQNTQLKIPNLTPTERLELQLPRESDKLLLSQKTNDIILNKSEKNKKTILHLD